jgi:hypothetical protein
VLMIDHSHLPHGTLRPARSTPPRAAPPPQPPPGSPGLRQHAICQPETDHLRQLAQMPRRDTPAATVIVAQNIHIGTVHGHAEHSHCPVHNGGYRVPPTRRAVTVGNEAPPAGLASKVPDGSDPSTLAWPSRCPAALRRRHRHPAAQRSWSRSFAPGDTFLTGTPTSPRCAGTRTRKRKSPRWTLCGSC